MLSFQNLADMSPRRKLFWAALAVVAFFQLIALYMVCSQQMQKAQVREATWNAKRGALIDCLTYLPKSTVGGCRSQVATSSDFSYR